MQITHVLLVLVAVNLATALDSQNGVFELQDENFADFVSKNQEVLVFFVNEWCSFCNQLYTEIVRLGLRTQRGEKDLKIAQIDTDQNKNTVNTYGVTEYPTILFFIGGEPFQYKGHRNEQDIYLWTQRLVNKDNKELQLNQLRILYDMKLAVLFLYPEENQIALKKFKKIQIDNPNTPFFHSTNEEIKKKLELKKKFNLIVFKDFNGGGQDFLDSNDQFTLDEMQEFIDTYTKLSVNYLDEEMVDKIFAKKQGGFVVFTDGMDEEKNPEMITYRDYTREHLNQMNFAYAKWDKGIGRSLFKYLGLTVDEVPVGVIVDFKDDQMRKFKLQTLTHESITNHINNYFRNKLQSYRLNKDEIDQKFDVEEINSSQLQDKIFDVQKQTFLFVYNSETDEEVIDFFVKASQNQTEFQYFIYDGLMNENEKIKIRKIPDLLYVNERGQIQYFNKNFNKYSVNEFIQEIKQKQVLSDELQFN